MNTKSIMTLVIIVIAIGGGIWLYAANTGPAAAPEANDNQQPFTENDPPVTPGDEQPNDPTMGNGTNDGEAGSANNDPAVSGGVGVDSDITVTTETEANAFTLEASNFEYSQQELRVQQGDTVTITIDNTEGFHDLVIDEFDVATDRTQAGETDSITFVADQAGEFEYYCSVGNHRQMGMWGTLIVEE